MVGRFGDAPLLGLSGNLISAREWTRFSPLRGRGKSGMGKGPIPRREKGNTKRAPAMRMRLLKICNSGLPSATEPRRARRAGPSRYGKLAG